MNDRSSRSHAIYTVVLRRTIVEVSEDGGKVCVRVCLCLSVCVCLCVLSAFVYVAGAATQDDRRGV